MSAILLGVPGAIKKLLVAWTEARAERLDANVSDLASDAVLSDIEKRGRVKSVQSVVINTTSQNVSWVYFSIDEVDPDKTLVFADGSTNNYFGVEVYDSTQIRVRVDSAWGVIRGHTYVVEYY